MLVHEISCPSSDNGSSTDALVSFVEHLQKLTPVAAQAVSAEQVASWSPLVQLNLLQFLTEIPIDDTQAVESVAVLLDQGLPTAFFNVWPKTTATAVDTVSILSTFPKQRIGISVTPANWADLQSVVAQYCEHVHAVVVRISAEVLADIGEGPLIAALCSLLKIATCSIDLYVELLLNTLTPQTAVSVGSAPLSHTPVCLFVCLFVVQFW
jgi:hypothetical protein